MLLTTVVFYITITVITAISIFWHHRKHYWSSLKIPQLTPRFPLGNLNSIFLKGFSFGFLTDYFYKQTDTRQHKYFGVYAGFRPILIITDPQLAKSILGRDFESFSSRGLYSCEENCLSHNLFTQGVEEWRGLRGRFSGFFGVGRIKGSYWKLERVARNLLEFLSARNVKIDAKEISSCFTADVICSVACGVDCNSFKGCGVFRENGRKYLSISGWLQFKHFLSFVFPKVSKIFGLTTTPKDVTEFFKTAIWDLYIKRKTNLKREDDFLQILLDLELNFCDIVRQVFMFFMAGYETSGKTICYCLYELAKNEHIQCQLREEVKNFVSKFGGITYEALLEMKYLHLVVKETLRMYPPVVSLDRECTKNWLIPGTTTTIKKGTKIVIPIYAMQHDEKFFKNPEKFDPERFINEKQPNCFLPFGDGPRQCLGMRLGLIEVKLAIATILKNFQLRLNSTTKPLVFTENAFVLSCKEEIWLDFEKIKTGIDLVD